MVKCSKGKKCGKACIPKKSKCKKKSRSKRSYKKSRSRSKNVIGPLNKNKLRQYGYSTSLPVSERRASLRKAVKAYGWLSVFRKLNAVATLNKNRSPTSSKKFLADRNWIKKTFSM